MKLNFTIGAPSPLIYYSQGWRAVGLNDPGLIDYANQTARRTSGVNSSATLRFNGTGIWLFGSTSSRTCDGAYNVTLDGTTTTTTTTTSTRDDNDQAGGLDQVLLFGQRNLRSGGHKITLTDLGCTSNTSSGALSLDVVTWERKIPDKTSPQGVLMDSKDPTLNYIPSDSWDRIVDMNQNKSLTVTQTQGASMNIGFTGSSVALSGSLSSTSGLYECAVDGASTRYTPVYGQDAIQQVLCFADGLDDDKDHVLAVTNVGSGSLSIDHAQFWGTNVLMFNPTVLTQPSAPLHHAKVIAGAVIGSIFGVIILLLAITVTLRKSNFMRKRLGLKWKELNDVEGKDPANLTASLSPRKLTSEVGTKEPKDQSRRSSSSTNGISEASDSIARTLGSVEGKSHQWV